MSTNQNRLKELRDSWLDQEMFSQKLLENYSDNMGLQDFLRWLIELNMINKAAARYYLLTSEVLEAQQSHNLTKSKAVTKISVKYSDFSETQIWRALKEYEKKIK
ncbi:MAG: hypothetical protein RIC03_06130 [Cyclobacteriaceae bacterium]